MQVGLTSQTSEVHQKHLSAVPSLVPTPSMLSFESTPAYSQFDRPSWDPAMDVTTHSLQAIRSTNASDKVLQRIEFLRLLPLSCINPANWAIQWSYQMYLPRTADVVIVSVRMKCRYGLTAHLNSRLSEN